MASCVSGSEQRNMQPPGMHLQKEEVLAIAGRCLDVYFTLNMTGERLGAILSRTGFDVIGTQAAG